LLSPGVTNVGTRGKLICQPGRRSNKNQLFGEIIARSENENSKQTKKGRNE